MAPLERLRESRRGTQAIKGDPSVRLQSNERFRTLTMQMLEPLFAVVVVAVGRLAVLMLERGG